MTIQPYPKYKTSEVEWLGEVPEHWQVKRLGYFFDERREKVSDKDFPPLSVTKQGVVPQLETAAKTDDGDNRKKVCLDDFVINSRSDRKGSGGIAKQDGSVSLINTVLTPRSEIKGAYIHHLLRSVNFQEEFYRYGQGIVADLWTTRYSEMRNIYIAMPSIIEQQRIAEFLDAQVAKIDALIEEQKRLIELLKEKRQAIITHAVTKGLNPNSPLKPSGVKWLGDVPALWEIVPLKRYWNVLDCKHVTAPFVDEGIPLASIREVQSRFVDLGDAKRTTHEFYRLLIEGGRRPKAGDLIFSRNATVGEVAQVSSDHPPFAMGQDVCLLRKNDVSQSTDFLQFQLRSQVALTQIDNLLIGSTFKRINVEEIRSLLVVCPSPKEQEEIAEKLESISGQFERLIASGSLAVSLLLERRNALISAAVTGKIDVRNAARVTEAA